jgi:outer membrane scaffolding protein for murein synthesis (MipA/OmpV family)
MLSGLMLVALGSAGDAADLQPSPAATTPPADGYIITLSGILQARPRFPGSDRLSLFGYPSLDWRRVGEPARFKAPDDGFDLTLISTPFLRLGPVARFEDGRYYSGNRKYTGLRKVPWSIEPGLFIEAWPLGWLRARVEGRYGAHGHEGFVGNLALDAVYPVERFTFSLGPRVAFGDTRFMGEYFSATPLEAALNGRVTPFKARGGVTSVGALASASYAWSSAWTTTVFAGYDRLVGDAADSPITRRLGSADQFTFGVSADYSFSFTP